MDSLPSFRMSGSSSPIGSGEVLYIGLAGRVVGQQLKLAAKTKAFV